MKHRNGKLTTVPKKRYTPLVTQEQLAEYKELFDLCRRKDALREKIIAMLDHGAVVEPGPLTATIKTFKRRSLSWEKLEEILGVSGAEEVRAQIPPSKARHLFVGTKDNNRPGWQ